MLEQPLLLTLLLGLPLLLAGMVGFWLLKQRSSRPSARAPARARGAPPGAAPQSPLDSRDWLRVLYQSLHGLLLGPSGSGKSVVAHHIATERARRGQRVIVCDPQARPGMWPGCIVVGGAGDFVAIERVLQTVEREVETRRGHRAAGLRRFPPLTLVLSNLATLLQQCPTARLVLTNFLQRGAKLNLHLLVELCERQELFTGDEAGRLLQQFDAQVTLRREQEARIAHLRGIDYRVPHLPDPADLADDYLRLHPELDVQPRQRRRAAPSSGPSDVEQWDYRTIAALVRAGAVSEAEALRALGFQLDNSGGYQLAQARLRAALAARVQREPRTALHPDGARTPAD